MAENDGTTASQEPDRFARVSGVSARLDSLAKILAAFSAVISAVAIPLLLNSYTEENRRAEMLLRTMTERERADTEIRQSMFQALVSGYLGSLKEDLAKTDEASFRRRMMFLELLTVNFQEYFNTKPLFEDVYRGLQQNLLASRDPAEQKKWEALEDQLLGASWNIVSRQVTMLNTLGKDIVFNIGKNETLCVRLYDQEDFATLTRDGRTRFESSEPGQCRNAPTSAVSTSGTASSDREGDGRRQSLAITLVALDKASAAVRLSLYEDVFAGHIFQRSVPKKSLAISVSRFDLPYMDNTKMSDGSRFALVLRAVDLVDNAVEIEAIRFRNDFISLRDRPFFEEMIQKLQGAGTTTSEGR
jgi:hypothetical protein